VGGIQHGGVVLLYHPCADRREVEKLRRVVTSCLRRHVITPSRLLSHAQVSFMSCRGIRRGVQPPDTLTATWSCNYPSPRGWHCLLASAANKHENYGNKPIKRYVSRLKPAQYISAKGNQWSILI